MLETKLEAFNVVLIGLLLSFANLVVLIAVNLNRIRSGISQIKARNRAYKVINEVLYSSVKPYK